MEDREIRRPAQAVRKTHAEPAGNASGKGRDDQLVEFLGSQGVTDGGERVGVTYDCSLYLEAGHPHPASANFGSRGGLGPTRLHVGRPGQTAGNRGDEKG